MFDQMVRPKLATPMPVDSSPKFNARLPVRRPPAPKLEAPPAPRQLKEGCTSCPLEDEEEETGAQLKAEAGSSADPAERQADEIGAKIGSDLASVGEISAGTISPEVASVAQSHLGVDVSGAQFKADAAAAARTRSAGAIAMTEGSKVSFGSGRLSSSAAGRALVGHELTHVAQQMATASVGAQLEVGRETDVEPRAIRHFQCEDFKGDRKLEACLNDEDRLRPGDAGESVEKVQRHLAADGLDVGPVDGMYGPKTSRAVMDFKRNHGLGFENFPDVGPGAMEKLDELCDFGGTPPWKVPPDDVCSYLRDDPVLNSVRNGDSVLRGGDGGESVQVIQQALLALGYPLPRFGADGKYGDETQSAVRLLQSDEGVNSSGTVDEPTITCIDGLCPQKTPPGFEDAWDVSQDNSVATAKADRAELWALALKVSGNQANRVCIWPISMKAFPQQGGGSSDKNNYAKEVRKGDTFDITNLTTMNPHIRVFRHIPDGERTSTAAKELYDGEPTDNMGSLVEVKSAEGSDPISQLTIVGHAAEKYTCGDSGQFKTHWDQYSADTPTPNFDRAKDHKGPKRCWFGMGASIRVVGCNSGVVAGHIARVFLRHNRKLNLSSSAWGTTCGVCGNCEKQGLFQKISCPSTPEPPTNPESWFLYDHDPRDCSFDALPSVRYPTAGQFNSAANLWTRIPGPL